MSTTTGRGSATDRLLPEDIAGEPDDAETLRRQRDFYKHLFESAVESFPHPVGVVDDGGVITHWNPGLADLVQVPADEAVGQTAYDVVGTEGEDEVLSERVARTGETVVEDQIRSGETPDGDSWHVRGAAFPVEGPDGDVVGAFQVNTDVTEIVAKNRALSELQDRVTDEVATATESLRTALSETAENAAAIEATTDEQADEVAAIRREFAAVCEESEAAAETAREVDDRGDDIEREMDDAEASVSAVVDTVESAADAAADVRERAAELDERADAITQVTETIEEVATQTNLLALNANIEAARASAGGNDGFEVVADEVKELATRAQEEAEKVTEEVAATRDTIDETVAGVEQLDDRLSAATEEARDLESTQAAIAEDVRAATEDVATVADAVTEQADRTRSLEGDVEQLAARTRDVSERVSDIAAATTEQTETVGELDETVQQVAREFEAYELGVE